MAVSGGIPAVTGTALAGAGDVRAPAEVFDRIFVVFLGLGTLVGVVVIAYTLYNAYKYRYREYEDPAPDADRPEVGELPQGGGKGKKLFLSFGLSAFIVLSLVAWTYGALVAVENGPQDAVEDGADPLEIQVEGFQFGWQYTYPNGHRTGTLHVPEDRMVVVNVTSRDVMHNFGIPDFRVKTDAIPGETTEAWFVADETGTYSANCYELCGVGHSQMNSEVVVMNQTAYEEWYAGTEGDESASESATGNETTSDGANGNGTAADADGGAKVVAP
jgi:cytochrome c oxidase subunit 2